MNQNRILNLMAWFGLSVFNLIVIVIYFIYVSYLVKRYQFSELIVEESISQTEFKKLGLTEKNIIEVKIKSLFIDGYVIKIQQNNYFLQKSVAIDPFYNHEGKIYGETYHDKSFVVLNIKNAISNNNLKINHLIIIFFSACIFILINYFSMKNI